MKKSPEILHALMDAIAELGGPERATVDAVLKKASEKYASVKIERNMAAIYLSETRAELERQ
jgi:hypothetical protein